MPIFFPRRLFRRTSGFRCTGPTLLQAAGALVAASAVWCSGVGMAQTLAHPNWVGNGMSTDPWWQHAVLYRVDGGAAGSGAAGSGSTGVDCKYLTLRVNALRSLGVDALVVPAPAIPAAAQGQAGSAQGQVGSAQGQAGSAAGDVDALDELVRTASTRGLRVLLALQPSPEQDLNGIARFWLSRGIAGFYLLNPPGATAEENQATVELLRRITASVVGQRIVLSEMDSRAGGAAESGGAAVALPVSASRRGGSRGMRGADSPSPGLQVDTEFAGLKIVSAASLRAMLTATAGRPNLLLEMPQPAGETHSMAEVLAAVALTTHPAALISSEVRLELEPMAADPEPVEPDPPVQAPAPAPRADVYLPYKPYVPAAKKKAAGEGTTPSDPLTAWYKQLAALHHANAAVRAADPVFLDFDGQNAVVWVERAATVSNATPAVVVACNLSGAPVTLSLRAGLEAQGLRGSYLRTLLRSDKAMGPQDLGSVVVPAYGVYVGELRR